MSKWILFFIFVITGISADLYLFNQDGTPKEALKRIFLLENTENYHSWNQVRAGKDNIERCDLTDSASHLLNKEIYFTHARELGLFSALYPKEKSYQGCLIYGAMLPSVRSRVAYLMELWEEGIHFDKIYFITGFRPLRKSAQESIENLTDPSLSPLPFKPNWSIEGPYETEIDMIYQLVAQIQFPQNFPDIEVVVASHVGPRATLKDTLGAFSNRFGELSPLIGISSPLHVHYHHLVGNKIIPIETVAKEETGENLKVSVLLDTLAKILKEL